MCQRREASDVEVGVYLSGGVDSSIVAAFASESSARPIRTFSVQFDDPALDESAEQRAVVERLGTRHTSVSIGGGDIADYFPRAVFHAEMPAFRTAFEPTTPQAAMSSTPSVPRSSRSWDPTGPSRSMGGSR